MGERLAMQMERRNDNSVGRGEREVEPIGSSFGRFVEELLYCR